VLKFQFPKDALEWIEDHEGLAAWVQAFGVITSLSAAVYFSRLDVIRRRKAEQRRGAGLVSLLPVLDEFRNKIIAAGDNPREAKRIQLPKTVMRHARDFQLLEVAAGYFKSLQEQLMEANRAIAALRNEQPRDSDQPTEAENDIRDKLIGCREMVEGTIDELRTIESESKKHTLNKIRTAILRFAGRGPST
jgi:hypothetical protein